MNVRVVFYDVDEAVDFLSKENFETIVQNYINDIGVTNLANKLNVVNEMFRKEYMCDGVFMYEYANQIIGIAGAIPLFHGVVEWFSYRDITVSPFLFAKVSKWFLRYLQNNPEIFRIQATVWEGHRKAQHLHEKLGFKQEGYMRKFDMQQNSYYLYGWVK